MSYKYEAVRSYWTGTLKRVVVEYDRGSLRDKRGDAITDGFQAWGHDDFNIAVWEGDSLVSWDWMDEPVESDPLELGLIEASLHGIREMVL